MHSFIKQPKYSGAYHLVATLIFIFWKFFWTEDPDFSVQRHTVTVEPKATLGQHRSGRGGVASKPLLKEYARL